MESTNGEIFVDDRPGSSTSSEVPDKPKRKRPKFIRKVNCQVCGDVANDHVHYGAIACYSCRAFFRRGVTNHTPFYCAQDQKCQITKATRKHCQYCRFQKCVGIGMKADWVMTEDDKKEKKEISQQKRLLNDIVADRQMLKGATTTYEKRMRLERQLSRAEKRQWSKTGSSNSENNIPPLIPVSPAPSSTILTSSTTLSNELSNANIPQSSGLGNRVKSPQPLTKATSNSPSSSDTDDIGNEERSTVPVSIPALSPDSAPMASMVTASTAAILYDYSQPMTVDSGYLSVHSETSKEVESDISDDEVVALPLPHHTSSATQELLPSNENQVLRQGWRDLVANVELNSNPVMNFTSEERCFIQKLLQIELETSRSIPVPKEVMTKICTAAKVGAVIPVEVAVRGYTVCMERVIKFASMVDFFKKLSVKDQFNLLLKNVDMVVNIRTARVLKPGVNLRDQLSHAIGWRSRSFDQMALSFSSSPSTSQSFNQYATALPTPTNRRLELFQMFPSPWASNEEYEKKYSNLLKNIFDLNMDHMTTSLLTMMALFNTSISELEYPQEVKNVQDNFTKLLYRYLCSEIGKVNAMKLLPQYSQTLRNLEEMAEILATKRLKI